MLYHVRSISAHLQERLWLTHTPRAEISGSCVGSDAVRCDFGRSFFLPLSFLKKAAKNNQLAP